MERNVERRLLQLGVACACLVPVAAGAAGVLRGPSMIQGVPASGVTDLESHFRYLSGLLFGLGLAFASTIPAIERRSALFALLAAIVVIGGVARLGALLSGSVPGPAHILALGMELMIVPLLLLWQRRIARRFRP